MSGILVHDKSRFESLVESLIKADINGSFGKLHVVTINHGENNSAWLRQMPKIEAIVERILHDRLSAEDACLQLAPDQYMLLFPRLTEAEGAIRATVIAKDIKQHLFGQKDPDLDVSVQLLPLSRLKSRSAVSSVETMDKVLTCHAASTGIHLDTEFQPVWDARKQAVIGNRLCIRRTFGGQEIFGASVLFGGETDPLAVEVNRVLRRAATHANEAGAALILPQLLNDAVFDDSETIADPIARLARACGGPLVVELGGAIGTLPRTRLKEVIRSICGVGAQVAVMTVPDMETARFLYDCGARMLCIDVRQISRAGLSPTATIALFTVIAHEVQGLGFRICLWNATTAQEIKRTVSLGFRYFSGPLVGDNQTTPTQTGPKASEQIFS